MPQELNTALMEDDLRLDSQQPFREPGWLEDSYRNIEDFWRALKSAFDSRYAMQRGSALFGRYNFYHDIIVRNRDNQAPALCWHDPADGLSEISYHDLGQRAVQKASLWVYRGLQPGQTLCIIRPMGLELAVDLLAALVTGSKIAFLPPQGKGFLKRRLEALGPDHITIDEQHDSLIPEWKEHILAEDRAEEETYPELKNFHAYLSEEVVFSCFDPCCPTPELPVDITSEAAYLCAMRDGMIGLGLGPGQVYAAPGFHFLETQPALLLAGLFCGATYLHLWPNDIADNPQLVTQKSIKAFGMSQQVRDLLLENPVDAGTTWEGWFRNPAESNDLEQWQLLVRDMNLKNAYAFNMKWDATLGGCSFYSLRRKGQAHMNVLPVPGSAWSLGDLSGGGAEAVGDSGTFTLSAPGIPEGEPITTTGIVVKNKQEWTFAGTNISSRKGRIYPKKEILATLGAMRTIVTFWYSVTEVPRTDPGRGPSIDLLVFTGSHPDVDEAMFILKIREAIKKDMGDEFQPDKIAFFPLYPRFLPGKEVDHDWCRSEYLTSGLAKKTRGEIFRCLTRLRGSLLQEGAA